MKIKLRENTITAKEAADILNIDVEKLRQMLKLKLVPFGIAIQTGPERYTYTVFKSRLCDYLHIPFEIEEE